MEGLAVTTGEQCMIADTDEAVAAAVVTLLEDAALRSRVGEAAREWAVAHLGWAQTVAAYDALYDRLLGDDANDDIAVMPRAGRRSVRPATRCRYDEWSDAAARPHAVRRRPRG